MGRLESLSDAEIDVAFGAGEVGAYDPFLIIHLVGPLEDPHLVPETGGTSADAIIAGVAHVMGAVTKRFPGHHDLRYWIVHMVGQVLDPPEREFLTRALDKASPGLRGVVLSTTASHARVGVDRDEQAGFAADAALVLAASALEGELHEADPVVWAVGVSSVTYARKRLALALAHRRMVRILDEHLLGMPGSAEPAYELGQRWVADSEDLRQASARELLIASPAGGSLLAHVRIGVIDWDRIPLTSWADVLTSTQRMLGVTQTPMIRDRIAEARQEWLHGLKEQLLTAAMNELADSARLESVLRFLAGVRAALDQMRSGTVDARPSADPGRVVADTKLLRRFARTLPYGSAVAARLLAVVVGVLIFLAARFDGNDPSVLAALDQPWARIGASAVLLTGFVLYQRRLAATLRVRDRLGLLLERQLVDRVERLIADAYRSTISELVDWIGMRPEWLDEPAGSDTSMTAGTLCEWYAAVALHTRAIRAEMPGDAEHRESGSGAPPASVFALRIPDSLQILTEPVAREVFNDPMPDSDAVKRIAAWLAARCDVDTLAPVSREELHHFYSELLRGEEDRRIWADLEALLAARPDLCAAARKVLEMNSTPGLVDGSGSTLPRHVLAISGGPENRGLPLIFGDGNRELGVDDSSREISGHRVRVIDLAVPNMVMMIHLYPMDEVVEGGASGR